MYSARLWFAVVVVLGAWISCGPATGPQPPVENCSNLIDDDGDGKVDCLDPQCANDSACSSQIELCDNNIDDNADGNIDCKDALCAGQGCGTNCQCLAGEKVYSNTGGGTGTGGGVGTGGGTGTGGGVATGGGVGTGGGTGTGGGLGTGGGTGTGGGLGTGGGTGTGGGVGTGGGAATGGGTGMANCVGTPWGTVNHGSSVTAYETSTPSIGGGKRCNQISQLRTCTNGVLSGTYTATLCRHYACFWNDAGVQNGGWYSEGDAGTYPYHLCQGDGGWSTARSPPQPAGPNYCEWAGVYFPRYLCGYLGDTIYLCGGPNWEATTGCPPSP